MAHKSPPPPAVHSDSRSKHMSNPISLHGVDISALDARDVCVGVAGELTSMPYTSPNLSQDRRQSLRSAHSPSLSAGTITADASVSHFDSPPGSRPRSVSNWVYPHRPAPASSSALSIRTKDGDNGACESACCVTALSLPLNFVNASDTCQLLRSPSFLRQTLTSVLPQPPLLPRQHLTLLQPTQRPSHPKSACLVWEGQNHSV
jgi:hypothetical protein